MGDAASLPCSLVGDPAHRRLHPYRHRDRLVDILRQLASYPRQNGVAAALRELGRLERTLFTLDWVNEKWAVR